VTTRVASTSSRDFGWGEVGCLSFGVTQGRKNLENFSQVVFDRQFVAAAVLNNGVDGGSVMPGFLGSKKQPIFHAEFGRSHGVLDEIIINL